MHYKDALVEANNYAAKLAPGNMIAESGKSWDYVKGFFQLLPWTLEEFGLGLKKIPGGWEVFDLDSVDNFHQMEEFYQEHSCPNCDGRGIV